jgi:hypothetical protein
MTELVNTIAAPYRFAKRNGDEYHVFSLFVNNPKEVDNWMGVKTQHNVLIDPDTFQELKNTRLEWIFDDNNVIIACKKLPGVSDKEPRVVADKKKEIN